MRCDFDRTAAMFDRMAADGWDPSSPLKWGFFFMARTCEPLDAVMEELAGHEYRRESLHQADDGTWVLQASKVEVLTADKLHRRNLAFNQLAEYCGAGSYDGWDVGRAEIA